ncbi:MAG: hypothetical protein AAF085_11085 [Planctomycetota bacterium]
MRTRLRSLTIALSLLVSGSAVAQEYAGPVVDRNVGDTGPNSASLRYLQPGLGQFGVGSLLLDRYDRSPHQFDRFNPIVGDGRTSHRYLMKAPGVSALMNRPDYIGPSPRGGWVLNQQTFDGSEVLTYGPDTVFVLSRELLAPPTRQDEIDTSWLQHPNRVQPKTVGDPNQIMRGTRVTGQRRDTTVNKHPAVQHDPNYVHPEIIERRKRWKAEREAEEAAKQAEADQAKQDEPQRHEEHEEKKTD